MKPRKKLSVGEIDAAMLRALERDNEQLREQLGKLRKAILAYRKLCDDPDVSPYRMLDARNEMFWALEEMS